MSKIFILIVIVIIIAGGIFWWQSNNINHFINKWIFNNSFNLTGCDIYQTKQCPDGSYVSRTGPNCEFAACPEPVTCENLCGDGICQEVVCSAIGCPCPETKESCPQDCSVVDTSTWQTYRNEELGFEFKYPLNFEYKSGEGQIDFRQKKTTKNTLSYLTFTSLENSSLEKWLSSDDKIISTETRIFGDINDGIFYVKKWSNGSEQAGYVFNHDSKTYSFWNEDAAFKSLFFKILSTFKFIK